MKTQTDSLGASYLKGQKEAANIIEEAIAFIVQKY